MPVESQPQHQQTTDRKNRLSKSITFFGIGSSTSLQKFIRNVSIQNQNTAVQYSSRLSNFQNFVEETYKVHMDDLLLKLRIGEYSPYDVLNDYCIFLKNNYNLSTLPFRDKIVTVKTFLEFNDIEISQKKFKLKVRFPKTVSRHKEAIDKEDIVKILNGCSDLRLKTYAMLLASTGLRATEALSIRLKDLTLNSNDNNGPAKLIIRGEYTKTKVDRYVFLTREVVEQLKIWIDYKYRKRRICHIDQATRKNITEYRTPEKRPNDLVFSIYPSSNSRSEISYSNFGAMFAKTLDRIGMGSLEEFTQNNTRKRRKITLHSFRRFTKTSISDLGFSDYSEWFIGHSGSTYWRKKDNEKAEIFKKIEPYLTFLNISQLNRQGADLETKIEELQDINQLLRNKQSEKEEQMKKLEESVAFLSDRFNAFLISQPHNRIVYDNGQIKGIELEPKLNNNASGEVVIPSSTNNNSRINNKKK